MIPVVAASFTFVVLFVFIGAFDEVFADIVGDGFGCAIVVVIIASVGFVIAVVVAASVGSVIPVVVAASFTFVVLFVFIGAFDEVFADIVGDGFGCVSR